MNYLDAFSAAISLISTILSLKANILHWPISYISYVTSGILYYKKELYSNVILEIAYFGIAIYGLKNWLTHRKQKTLIVYTEYTPNYIKKNILIFIPLLTYTLFLFVTQQYAVNKEWAMVDALATAISLPALWLMGRRYVECWILWFIADMIHSYLYFHNGLIFKGSVHAIYLGIAVWGYNSWKSKIFIKESPAVLANI